MDNLTNEAIVVSVSMVTYNHENYIVKAIESVIAQKTNFKFELVIGEDCSTDKTRKICLEYKNKYPDIINLRLNETNQGMAANADANARACKGTYCAILDGDDYWVDDYKLQKQVDILEADKTLIGVFTDYATVDLENNIIKERAYDRGHPNGYRMGIDEFLLKYKSYPTCTVMFRSNGNWDFLPVWFNDVPQPDVTLFTLLHLQGDFCFLNDVTLHYRINPKSVTKDQTRVKENLYKWFKMLDMQLSIMPAQYHKYYNKNWGYRQLARAYAHEKNLGKTASVYLNTLFKIKPFSLSGSINHLRDLLYIYRKG